MYKYLLFILLSSCSFLTLKTHTQWYYQLQNVSNQSFTNIQNSYLVLDAYDSNSVPLSNSFISKLKSKNNIVEQAAAQKEQKKTQKERTSQERLFDAKLAIFEIEDIKNSKNRKIKSKIRKAPTEIEAMAYATALLLNVINETEET